MNFQFAPATKQQSKARMALIGPSGSGKTFTALAIASGMGSNIAVIDTENGSASKYAGRFSFQTLNLNEHSPLMYVKAIEAAEKAGFDVLIIDSLSHAWMGRGGALEMVDNAAKRSQSGNSYTAWRDVTPMHNKLVDALIRCKCHLIVTMRAKTEYVMEKNNNGKMAPRKVGLAPVQRDGLDYEFDIVGTVDLDHNLIIDKTRCEDLDGKIFHKAGEDVSQIVLSWLSDAPEAPEDDLSDMWGNSAPAPQRYRMTFSDGSTDDFEAPNQDEAAAIAKESKATGLKRLVEEPQIDMDKVPEISV